MNFRKANMNHEGGSTLEEIFLSLKRLKSTVQAKTVETEEMLNQKSLSQLQFRSPLEQISSIWSRISATDRVTFDPRVEIHIQHIGSNIHIISLLPASMYVEIENAKFEQLDGLDRNVIPIFRQSMSVYVRRSKGKGSYIVRRRQVPCSSAFTIIYYRAQGWTFKKVALDLEVDRGGTTGHQNFAATYVMLSRATGFSGVSFLRWFRYDLLRYQPGEQYSTIGVKR